MAATVLVSPIGCGDEHASTDTPRVGDAVDGETRSTTQLRRGRGSGRLGNDSWTGFESAPVPVSGLTRDVVAIAAGARHGCAVVKSGAQCWGENGSGQLGNDSMTAGAVPVQVTGLTSGVRAIAAGHLHSCAVRGRRREVLGSKRPR